MHDPDPLALRRAATARRNGALSHGPVTPAGKSRSALNAVRHGLCAQAMPSGVDAHELAGLRAALLARSQPADGAEMQLVEELVFAAWRQIRLRAVEDAVLARLGQGEAAPDLPSLATLIRYCGRIERDALRAAQELLELRHRRPHASEPARLRWLAERIEQAQAIAVAFPPPGSAAESGTSDPTRIVATGSVLKKCTNELPIGTNEPTTANRTNDLPPGTNEPRRLVQPLPEGSSDASGVPPRCLNRHQRRRLAALRRRAA